MDFDTYFCEKSVSIGVAFIMPRCAQIRSVGWTHQEFLMNTAYFCLPKFFLFAFFQCLWNFPLFVFNLFFFNRNFAMMSSTIRVTIRNLLLASKGLSNYHHPENCCYGTEKHECKTKDGRWRCVVMKVMNCLRYRNVPLFITSFTYVINIPTWPRLKMVDIFIVYSKERIGKLFF